MKKVFSFVFLILGIVIALGAFGHGYSAMKVHAALDNLSMDPAVRDTLFIVWYFVSGTMVLFGLGIIWAWLRFRNGDKKPLIIGFMVAVLYLISGIGAMVYTQGRLFWSLFIIEGALLLTATLVMRSGPARQ